MCVFNKERHVFILYGTPQILWLVVRGSVGDLLQRGWRPGIRPTACLLRLPPPAQCQAWEEGGGQRALSWGRGSGVVGGAGWQLDHSCWPGSGGVWAGVGQSGCGLAGRGLVEEPGAEGGLWSQIYLILALDPGRLVPLWACFLVCTKAVLPSQDEFGEVAVPGLTLDMWGRSP